MMKPIILIHLRLNKFKNPILIHLKELGFLCLRNEYFKARPLIDLTLTVDFTF